MNYNQKSYYPDKDYNIVYGELFSIALVYNKLLIIREMLEINENFLKQSFSISNDQTGEKWEYNCESYINEYNIEI